MKSLFYHVLNFFKVLVVIWETSLLYIGKTYLFISIFHYCLFLYFLFTTWFIEMGSLIYSKVMIKLIDWVVSLPDYLWVQRFISSWHFSQFQKLLKSVTGSLWGQMYRYIIENYVDLIKKINNNSIDGAHCWSHYPFRTAICQSVVEVELTGMVLLRAVSHRFNFNLLLLLLLLLLL